MRDVLCADGDAAGAALGTDNQIRRTLVTPRNTHRVFGALRRCPPRVGQRRLDHFFTQDGSRRGRAIELERTAALRNVSRIALHLVDHLLGSATVMP